MFVSGRFGFGFSFFFLYVCSSSLSCFFFVCFFCVRVSVLTFVLVGVRLHAKETSRPRKMITQKRNPVDFSFPSRVGVAKPCAQVGSAQHVPLDLQQETCWVIHLYVRLTRGLCSSEVVQSPVIREVRAHSILQSHACDMFFGAACIYTHFKKYSCDGVLEKVS